jgi:tetratricopeptide (TPR) repeat protein
MKMAQTLLCLEKFSLIKWSRKRNTISVHRLIQAVLQDQMNENDYSTWSSTVIKMCDLAFPVEATKENRLLCRRYQGQVAAPLLSLVGLQKIEVAEIMHRVGVFMTDEGKLKDGERLCYEAVKICSHLMGSDDLKTINMSVSLALNYRKQGRLAEAAELGEKTLSTARRVLSEEHPDTLTAMNSLGNTYNNQERLEEAVELLEKTLSIRRRLLGEDHPDTLKTMINLGNSYSGQERWTEAEELREKTLSAARRVLGEEHSITLMALNNLAITYKDQEQLLKAAELQEQTLSTTRRLFGDEHSDTMRAMYNLANTYFDLGRSTQAIELQTQTVSARRKVLGEDHSYTLRAMRDLAQMYSASDDPDQLQIAANLAETAYVGLKKQLGEAHPDTQYALDIRDFIQEKLNAQQEIEINLDASPSQANSESLEPTEGDEPSQKIESLDRVTSHPANSAECRTQSLIEQSPDPPPKMNLS